jgi:hypothetical protein
MTQPHRKPEHELGPLLVAMLERFRKKRGQIYFQDNKSVPFFLTSNAREKNAGLPIRPQANNAAIGWRCCHQLLHLCPRCFFRPPHESEKLRQIGQQFGAVLRQVRPGLTTLEQRSAQYADESKRCRSVNPNQKICT